MACANVLLAQSPSLSERTLQDLDGDRKSSSDWVASQAIITKVQAGNKKTLCELSHLDPAVSVPPLAHYAKDRSTDSEASTIAIVALKQVHGLRAYFRQRIAQVHALRYESYKVSDEFDTLALIATQEAAAAAAPFLFDDSGIKADYVGSDYSCGVPIRYEAVMALLKMNLSDAPTSKPFYRANDDDIIKWRDWWSSHRDKYER